MIHVPSTEEACAAPMPIIDNNTPAHRGVIAPFSPISVVINLQAAKCALRQPRTCA